MKVHIIKTYLEAICDSQRRLKSVLQLFKIKIKIKTKLQKFQDTFFIYLGSNQRKVLPDWGRRRNPPACRSSRPEDRRFPPVGRRRPSMRRREQQQGSDPAPSAANRNSSLTGRNPKNNCLSRIFGARLKNQKSIAADVLCKAYPTVPLSCRFNLAGGYL